MLQAETPFVPHVPVLPEHIDAVNQVAQTIFTVGQLPPILISVFLARRYQKAYGTMVPWLFLLGGLLMCLIEPLVDANGRVWFPVDGQWSAYRDFGVSLPVWLVLAYVWFFGGRAMVIWHLLEQGRAKDKTWIRKHWLTVFLTDAVLENVGLYLGLFLYYGHQPLQVGRFPLWWGSINSTTPIVLATVVVLARKGLTGWRQLLVVPLAPMIDAGVNAFVGWLTWDAINNTEVPVALVWVTGLAAFASAYLLLQLCQRLLEHADRIGHIRLDGSGAPTVRYRRAGARPSPAQAVPAMADA